MNAILQVYSIYKRCNFVYAKGNFDHYESVTDLVPPYMLKKAPRFIVDNCTRIYNEIENSRYFLYDVVLACAYQSIWKNSIDITQLNSDIIPGIKYLFSNKSSNEDKRRFVEIIKTMEGIGNSDKYFEINEKGESIIYVLIYDKVLSPAIFLCLLDRITAMTSGERLFFDKSKRYRKFELTMNSIKNITNNQKQQN